MQIQDVLEHNQIKQVKSYLVQDAQIKQNVLVLIKKKERQFLTMQMKVVQVLKISKQVKFLHAKGALINKFVLQEKQMNQIQL